MSLSLLKTALLFSLLFYLLLWLASRRSFLGDRLSGTNLVLIAVMPFFIYLVLYVLENSSAFQAKTPFGEISFQKVAQEIQMAEAVPKIPSVPFEESRLAKGAPLDPKQYVPVLLRERPICLTLTLGHPYDLNVLRNYLEVLEGFSFFRYVVFLERDGRFIGFLPAKDFSSLFSLFGPRILELLYRQDFALQSDPVEDLKQFLNLNTQSVTTKTTADQVLALLEKKHLRAVAVVDEKGRFAGITEAEDLLLLIVNRLLAKEKTSAPKPK